MVSSASDAEDDAEDIVQEAFLQFHRESSNGTQIESPRRGCPRSPPDS
jgi:DNA-directed RNA polymerase specialized sigma24 family protein